MTFYEAMVNRYVIPVIEKHKAEGRAEGLAQGLEQGREQGIMEAHQEWAEWNRRRVDAQHRGRNFDEAPPHS